MKDHYFAGQNYKSFFYFYYGKIIKTNNDTKSSQNYYVIDGVNFDIKNGFKRGEFKVPQRYDLRDDPDQYDVDRKTAQRGVVKLILGDEYD